MSTTTALVLSVVVIVNVVDLGHSQDNHAARCGPFFNWRACPDMNDQPQCCSKWGYCSESNNQHAQVCAQQDIGDYFWNAPALCHTDAECQLPGNAGPFVCSQEPDTNGACALKGFHAQFNGTNPFGGAVRPEPSTAALNHDKIALGQDPNPPPSTSSSSSSQDQAATSSSISSSQTSLLITIAMLITAVVLIAS